MPFFFFFFVVVVVVVLQLFSKFDVDRSGAIDFDEFYELLKYLNYPKRMTEGKAMKLFVKADRNQTGLYERTLPFCSSID